MKTLLQQKPAPHWRTALLGVLAALLCCIAPAALSQPAPKKIVIGLLPEMNIFRQKERFEPLEEYLTRKLGIRPGETTEDGMFTLLPTACIGYCDLSPAMLINGRAYGPLTPEKIDEVLNRLRTEPPKPRMAR